MGVIMSSPVVQDNMPQKYESSATILSSYSSEPPKRHAERLRQFNQEMFQRNVLTDIECIIEGQVFKTHRALLVCFCPYLKKYLIDADGRPSNAKKIVIPEIGAREFEILLQYMYYGNVVVDLNNFYDIYQVASFLEMEDAMEECLKLLDGGDEIKTYFYSYVSSKKLGMEHNWQKALKLITHRFEETVFTREFMQLNLNHVLEILSAQSIGARSEAIVFLAALNWLNEDYGSRVVHAASVMQCVRFSCMSMEEILSCFHPPFLTQVVQISELVMMLFKAMCYVAAKSQGKEDWFQHYAHPKRNLTVEGLPMELWNKETSHSATAQQDSQRENFTPRRRESRLREILKSQTTTDAIKNIIDSKEPEIKKLKLINAKIEKLNIGKEDSNIPSSPDDKTFLNGFTENILEESSDNFTRTGLDFSEGFPKKEDKFLTATKNREYEDPYSTRPKSVADERKEPREIRYVIPNNTKVIHLVKGPIKFTDENSETKPAQFNDCLKKFPQREESNENNKISLINEDEFFSKKGNKKSVGFKDDSFSQAKYHTEDEFKKSEIDREMTQRKTLPSFINAISSDQRTADENGCILVIGGMNPRNLTKESGGSVHIFLLSTHQWIYFTSLFEPRHNHCSSCLGNNLYVVGGCKPQETIEKTRYTAKRSCFKMNLENSMWTKMPDMNCARYEHAMVAYGGCLIVIGGQDENGRLLKSMEMYDPKKNVWKLLDSSMCCGRKAMGVAVHEDSIWIAGGQISAPGNNTQLQMVSHVDCYHPREGKWNFNSYSLPSPRCFCCLIDWNGDLYCIGGVVVQKNGGKVIATDEVWFVSNEDELWKEGPSLPEPRMGGTAVIYGENLYYLGGYDPENTANVMNVIFLTPGASCWSIGPPMTFDTFGLSAVSIEVTNENIEPV